MTEEKRPCPRGCGQSVAPRALAGHLAGECPKVQADRAEEDPDQTDLTAFGGER